MNLPQKQFLKVLAVDRSSEFGYLNLINNKQLRKTIVKCRVFLAQKVRTKKSKKGFNRSRIRGTFSFFTLQPLMILRY